jgi:5-hydroxyisourate hydrolase
MSTISTHVLDTALGRPARGVPVRLEMAAADGTAWHLLGEGRTDDDGRLRDLAPPSARLGPGTYRLRFDTGAYLAACAPDAAGGFYPWVEVVFAVRDPDRHYHVPLLLSPYGYATYRGS